MRLNKAAIFGAALTSAFMPAAFADDNVAKQQPAPVQKAFEPQVTQNEAKAPDFSRRPGDEFTMRVSYGKDAQGNPAYRTVGIDADTLVLVTLKDGKKALAATVAFISNFDLIPDSDEFKKVVAMTNSERSEYLNALQPQARDTFESMLNLPAAQRDMIQSASRNMTTDKAQVSFMLQHVVSAHGIAYDDVKNAAEYAKKFWGLESKLTDAQIKELQIVAFPNEEEKQKPAAQANEKKEPEKTPSSKAKPPETNSQPETVAPTPK